MSTQISKRILLGKGALAAGVGVGALALLAPQRASADTPFTSFSFPATGAPTPRTMPDRLAEIKNVKDFGALGNGSVDDAPAIQRAVNWTTSPQRGTIYFPPGIYRVNSPITVNASAELSIIFRGEGLLSQLTGSFWGYILDLSQGDGAPGIALVERLDIKNPGGGGVRILGRVGAEVRNCRIQAHVGVELGSSSNSAVNNCLLNGMATYQPGSIGILMGPGTAVYNCGIVNWHHGIRAYGAGISITSCRIEVNSVGLFLGRDGSDNTVPVSGAYISGTSTEANDIGFYAWSMTGTHVSGCMITGTWNAPSGKDPFMAFASILEVTICLPPAFPVATLTPGRASLLKGNKLGSRLSVHLQHHGYEARA